MKQSDRSRSLPNATLSNDSPMMTNHTPAILYKTLKIGKRFRSKLRHLIGEEQFNEMARLNMKNWNQGHCHSHDYCDANMVMLNAWREITGSEFNMQDLGQKKAWQEAWIKARLYQPIQKQIS